MFMWHATGTWRSSGSNQCDCKGVAVSDGRKFNRISNLVEEHLEEIIEAWHGHFGT